MFDADSPILKSDQDRLGRTVFAKYLARCILDHKSTESLVIGLYGTWGVGKTSLINLAIEELRYASNNMFDNEKPIILNFSPWSHSGQKDLIFRFFRRLSMEMRHADYFENSEKIIHLLELYISFFTHKPVPKSLKPHHFWITNLFKRQRNAEESIGWESGLDLTTVKAELNELLGKQQHKLIIFIDNIPRLEDAEINTMFQIVKSIGNYANTFYVLALDHERVVAAINKTYGYGGAEYLEKIVQLPFEVPAIAKQDLESILLDRLKKVMTLVPEESWDADYWGDIYYSTIKYFFETSRDITRYINTVSFGYIYVKDLVNPVDFFAITAIEVFEPQVFYGIRDNKDLFVALVEHVYRMDDEKLAEDKRRCDEILNRATRIPVEMLEQLIIRLFPRLRAIYQEHVPFYHSEQIARKNKRICSFDIFEIYFRLIIPSGYMAEEELNAILSLSDDEEGFALALLRLNQDNRIPKFLDLLDSIAVHRIPINDIANVISALIDSADLFPQGESSRLNFNTPVRVHRIIHQLLNHFDNSNQRFEVLREAIKKADKSLYIIVHELLMQDQEQVESEDTNVPVEFRDVDADQLTVLKKLAVTKILFWAETGRLAEHPQLLPILYTWKIWGEETECARYVAKMTQEDRGLVAFLLATLKDPVLEALNKEVRNPAWRKNLKYIEDFISVEALIPHAQELFEDNYFEKLRETEQLAIMIFLDLVKPSTKKEFPKTTA